MWLRRRKGKNPFEGSLIVDNPDIKVVEAKYDNKPVLLAVGTSKQRELKISGKGNTDGLGAQYQTQKDLDWQVLFNPKALPDFIPIEKAKELMAGTIAVTSGNASVYTPETKVVETTDENLNDLLANSWSISGNTQKDKDQYDFFNLFFKRGEADAGMIVFKKEEEKEKNKKDRPKKED